MSLSQIKPRLIVQAGCDILSTQTTVSPKSLTEFHKSWRLFNPFSVFHKRFTIWTPSKNVTVCATSFFHIITSFVNVLLEAQEQSKPLLILFHDFYFGLSTHAKRIKSWLHEAKKTCQVHFLEVEAKLKKERGYFAQQFVILGGLT